MTTEGYQPSSEEKHQLRMQPDSFKVSGDGVFFTLQGEGQSIGKPAVFLRLHFCNLHCEWCDTKYTWDKKREDFWTEAEDWTIDMAREKITAFPADRLVITGGEPLLQQDKIAQLISTIPDWNIEVETNGTVAPAPELAARCQFNVSPKLSNSGNSPQLRYRPDVLRAFNQLPLTTFKFVVQSDEDIKEVEAIVADCKLDTTRILIMPEGTTQEDITIHGRAVADSVKDHGWRLLPRMHVMLWGNERKV